MSDEKLTESPGLPAGDRVNTRPIHGGENPVNAASIDWGESPPVSAEKQPQRQVEWTALKARVKDADPKTLTRAEKYARTIARKEEAHASQRKEAGGVSAQAAAVTKPPRKRAAQSSATTDQSQPATANATRTRKKAAQAAALVPAQGQPALGAIPAVSTVPAAGATPAINGIPPITPEAISFLGKQDVTAADVLKLGPDSLAFVQHHFNFLRRIEPDGQANKAYLMANTFAGALLKLRSNLSPDNEQPTASFGPKEVAIAGYTAVAVQFGKMELGPENADGQEQTFDAMMEDTKRAHKVAGTAAMLMSAKIYDLTHQEAVELVAADVEEVRAIKDENARQLAFIAMAKSSLAQPRYNAQLHRQAPEMVGLAAEANHVMDLDCEKVYGISSGLAYAAEVDAPLTRDQAAKQAKSDIEAIRSIKIDRMRWEAMSASFQIGGLQPLYKDEFKRQAPDLVEPLRAAYKAESAKEALQIKEIQEPENSIERSPVQLVSNEQKPAQSVAVAEKILSAAAPRQSLGKRLMLVVGGAAQKAGTWLSDRGSEGQATPVAQHPQAAPTAPAMTASMAKQEPVAPAVVVPDDDKSTIVPDAVARRFLKVEREYYFADRTHAFSDRGQKLATRGADPEVIRSLVEIAKVRGWESIAVKGADDFRRNVWMESTQNGLRVVGYQPTSLDLAELANRPANNTVEKSASKKLGSTQAQQQAASAAQEQAAAQGTAASPVEPTASLQGAAPQSAEASKPDPELAKKAQAFAENKPSFVVKKYPDLAWAYGVVEAAKAFAAEKLPETAREEFVGLARRHVIQKILTGESVKGPKIYMAQAKTNAGGQAKALRAQEATAELEKTPRAKEVVRGR